MTVQVLLEDSFCGHQGNDLYDHDRAVYKVFRVKKTSTLQELMETFADAFVRTLIPYSPCITYVFLQVMIH